MTVFKTFHDVVEQAVARAVEAGALPQPVPMTGFVVELPRDPAHGDLATNIAMALTKGVGKPPRAVAESLKPFLLEAENIAAVEIAGPGFINLRLQPSVWQAEIKRILQAGLDYGFSNLGQGEKALVEYVSVNPTGPMHAGHVRGAVIGDVLANLLAKAGYNVLREYYFNDAGAQVDVLARTAYLRYCEALGEDIGAIPEGLYPGEYLKEVGAELAKRDGKQWLNKDEAEWLVPIRDFAVAAMMKMIATDLELIGVRHEMFTNERVIVENGTLDTAFKTLQDQDLIYVGTLPPPKGKVMEDWEPVPLTLFRSSKFGDSTDRPLKKRDGSWTYLMPDIAYHYDKIRRGYTLLINVLGTDHGGYHDRLRPIIAAFGHGKARLAVIYNSMVKVFKNGEPVKLSKRSGNIITLREMVEQVGAGAVRFFMLTRAPESPLDFDFAKVVEQTRDNPVFYVQYAHARCCSILRHAQELFPANELTREALAAVAIEAIHSDDELQLVKFMASWSRAIEAAAEACEPHRIAFYLMELAARFHGLWNKGNDNASLRFIVAEDKNLTRARLALIKAVQTVLQSGLAVMGCEALEELRSDKAA